MTTFARITEDINPIVAPSHNGASRNSMSQVQAARPLDPRSSLDDYNRVMLAYTQRRMSTFVDMDNGRKSPSSRSSNSSGDSGKNSDFSNTTSGVLSRQGDVASTPTSAATSTPQSHRDSETGQMAEQAQ